MVPNPFNTNNQRPIFETFKTQNDSESDNDEMDINEEGVRGNKDDNIIVKSKKKQNKKGLIGEGTFGCIYDDLNNPDKVHKIFLYKSQYKEELDIAAMLNNSFKQYNISFPKGLLLPDNIYNPSLPNEIDINFLTKSGYKVCKLLADKKNKNKNTDKIYKYLTYTNGGDALNNCLDEFNTVFDLLVSLDNIFDAIDKLQTVHISHHDIKMPNLLYDKHTKQTILIDYGITYKYSDLFIFNATNIKNWPDSYFVWPPEFHTIWYIMKYNYVPTARIMSDKVRSIVDVRENYVPSFKDMYENNDNLREFEQFRNELNKGLELEETLDRNVSLNKIANDELSKYFSTHFAIKSDVYGLAMVLYAFNKHFDFLSDGALESNLVKYLNVKSINELTKEHLELCKDIHDFIRKMGCANPYSRYTSQECNKLYTKYIREKLKQFKGGNILSIATDNIEPFSMRNNHIVGTSYKGATPTNPFAVFMTVILIITIVILCAIYL